MSTAMKWKTIVCLGWLLGFQGLAQAQDTTPPDVELLDVRFNDSAQQETVNLVLKSGSRKFKMVCDNVNNLAAMLEGLGFPKGHKPRRVLATSEVNQVLADLAQTEPLYCKSFAPRAGENPLNYAIGYFERDVYLSHSKTVANSLKTVLYKVTNCQGILKSFSYTSNATSETDRHLDNISRPKFQLAIKKDEQQNDLEIKCYKGKAIETEVGPVFAQSQYQQSIVAGQEISPIHLQVSDANHDEIETFVESSSCDWLDYNPATQVISGKSYPSTLPYACQMKVNAKSNGRLASQPVDVKIHVQPLLISKMVAGYRRNCTVFNDGKVSCWGAPTGTPGEKISREIEAFQNSSDLAITKSSAPNYQLVAGVRDNELFSFNTGFTTAKTDYNAIPSDVTLQKLSAGMDMLCVADSAGDTVCYGPNIRFYNVPATPEKYASFDMNYSLFCGQKQGEANIACRGTTLSYPADIVKKYSSSKDALCVLKTDNTVDCQSRRGTADLLVSDTQKPTSVSDFSLAFDYACALDSNKKPVCWGSKVNDGSLPPPEVTSLQGVQSVITGFDHTCLQMSNQQNVFCWGGSLFNNVDVSRAMDIVKLRKDLDLWETMPLDSF